MTVARAGDIFLEHDTHWPDRMIQLGQRLRSPKLASYWNHAGIVADDNGKTIEATARGVAYDTLGNPSRGETIIIPVEPAEARARVVAFAMGRVGDRYSYAAIGSIVVTLLTGARWVIAKAGTYICSGLAASALDFASCAPPGKPDMGDDPEWTYPAELFVPVFTAR